MKKKINILGTIALTTTASTSVIACGGKEETKSANPTAEVPKAPTVQPGTTNAPKPMPMPQPVPQVPPVQPEAPQVPQGPTTAPGGATVTKTNISNKITDNTHIGLGVLTTKSATEFLTKLNEKLKAIPGLENIKTDDYIVYKIGFYKKGVETVFGPTLIEDNNDITFNIDPNSFIVINSMNIKIVANGSNFEGEKDITVNYS